MENKIKANLDIYYSKRDKYGNVYFAATVTSTETGRSVSGRITGGEGNLRAAMAELYGFGSGSWHTTEQMLLIRDFDRLVKQWPYLGCAPKDIAKNVQEALNRE